MSQDHGKTDENFQAAGETPSPPTLTPAEKQAARSLLLEAFKAATAFDGSEPAENRLFDPLVLYDEFVRAHNDNQWSANELEELIANISFPDHPREMPLTIAGFLDRASSYYVRLKEANARGDIRTVLEKSGAVIQDERYVFVKTDDGALRAAESFNPRRFEIRTQPRLALLIAHLRNDGVNGQPIYMDDLVIRLGQVDPHMLRRYPYNIVQIPRLDMEIAACDQVGEITFVKKGTVGPEFWVFMSKDALKARDDIEPVEFRDEQKWWTGIVEALSTHAEDGPKINVASWAKRRSNLDLDLIKASLLAHRRATEEWLTHGKRASGGPRGSYVLEHGPYAGTITAGALNAGLSAGNRGLPGGSSIATLNQEIARQNGLDYFNQLNQESLDLGLIKASLLAYRQATGEWLSNSRKSANGKKGSYVLEHGPYAGHVTVSALETSLSIGRRGLPGGSSIAQLNDEISREHQLDYFNCQNLPSLDPILIGASLLAHRLATGEWLMAKRGADGKRMTYVLEHGPYAGQIDADALNAALSKGLRGLPGGSSIAQLNEAISRKHGLDYFNHMKQDDLDFNLIKASLLAHRHATGEWLSHMSRAKGGTLGSYVLEHGPYADVINVSALNHALSQGFRGLPGASSIAQVNKLLSNEHGLDYFNHMDQDDLDLGLIKGSLLAHYQATGEWLSRTRKMAASLYVLEHGPYAGQLTIVALDAALAKGYRGLPAGSSIAKLNRELAAELSQSQTPPPGGEPQP